MRIRAKRLLILFATALVAAAVANSLASAARRLSWIGSYPDARRVPPPLSVTAAPAPSGTKGPESFGPHPDRPWIEISTDQASELFRRGTLFLDARRGSVYAEGHIAGARSFPVWESGLEDRIRALHAEGRDTSAPIVAYCSGGDCEDSHMLAEKVFLAGFDALFVHKDGFPDWQAHGLPVEKGSTP